MTEILTKNQIKEYCKSYISETPLDISVMELHRLLNCDEKDVVVVIKETIKYLQDWCKRNEVEE